MKIKVEVTACDLDKVMPAKTFEITVDGETHELDLCKTHGQPIEDVIEAAREKREQAPAPQQVTVPPMQFTPPSPPPRQPAAQPAEPKPARITKRSGKRRPRIVSMEEIERQKAAQQAAQD